MNSSAVKHFIQSSLLFLGMLTLATISEADEISEVLASHFSGNSEIRYIDYESIDQVHADEYGSMRYLVMDFDIAKVMHDEQSSIHTICSRVLNDRPLIHSLSNAGYDMIAVSFDRRSQFDCL